MNVVSARNLFLFGFFLRMCMFSNLYLSIFLSQLVGSKHDVAFFPDPAAILILMNIWNAGGGGPI